jgi:hypothetical protein
MASIPAAGAPITITANRHPIEQGQMPPSLAGHCRHSGESLLFAESRLGLLLCHDAGFCLLLGVGLCLLHMRRPLSCKGSSLLGRGSWIVVKVPSSCGRKGWRPLHVRLGRLEWNMTLVMPVPMPSSGTSSPGARLQFPVQKAHQPWSDTGGMPYSSLPTGDGPRGVGGDIGRGAGA